MGFSAPTCKSVRASRRNKNQLCQNTSSRVRFKQNTSSRVWNKTVCKLKHIETLEVLLGAIFEYLIFELELDPGSPADQRKRLVLRMIHVKDSRSYQWAKFGFWTSRVDITKWQYLHLHIFVDPSEVCLTTNQMSQGRPTTCLSNELSLSFLKSSFSAWDSLHHFIWMPKIH